MTQELGRRERKKLRTRQALVDAAVRLFAEKGYEQTTVVDIAEAADVSDRTFFLHFPTKEDVLLSTADIRHDIAVRAVTGSDAGESPSMVLERAIRDATDHTWQSDVPSGLAALRARLVASNPTLQAKLLQRWLAFQSELAEALRAKYPDRFDPTDAASAVGAVVGAVTAAVFTSFAREDTLDQTREAMHRAVDFALHRMDSLTR